MASDDLDPEICKQMSSLVELLTTSGRPILNPDIMKKFKKLCRTSDLYIEHAFRLLMSKLTEDHSEVRLSTFQIINELFNRSHAFRELLLTDFQAFLQLTVGIDIHNPLPPPKVAADNLKTEAYKSIQLWYEKFGEAYKKLTLGYQFLKTCKKVDFVSIQARTETERRQKEEVERKIEENRRSKLQDVLNELSDSTPNINMCVTEVENGIQLLLPHPEDFFISVTHPSTTSSTLNTLSDTPVSANITSSTRSTADLCTTSADVSSDASARTSSGSAPTLDNSFPTEDMQTSHLAKCTCEDTESDKFVKSAATDNETEKLICKLHDPKVVVGEEDKTKCKHKENDKKVVRNKLEDECDDVSEQDIASHVNADSAYDGNDTNNTSNNADDISDCVGDTDKDELKDESDISDDDFEDVAGSGGLNQEFGLFSHRFEITVNVGEAPSKLQVTDDNKDIINNVREHYRLIKSKYLPNMKRWIQVMTKCAAKQDSIKETEAMKEKLEDAVKKCIELEVITDAAGKESDSDDEFEEVPEKEGYEADVPEHVRLEAASQSASSGTKSKQKSKDKRKSSKASKTSENLKKALTKHWKLSERLFAEDEKDPTTWISNVSKLKRKSAASSTITSADVAQQRERTNRPGTSSYKSQTNLPDGDYKKNSLPGTSSSGPSSIDSDSRKKCLLEKAPVVSFGLDLEHWENQDEIKAPIKDNKHDGASRFWVASNEREDESGTQEEIAALTRRTMTYTGNFEPVKWECRAPLPDGRLCMRMDRVKCPFHGKVIGRDKLGQPTDPEELEKLLLQKYLDDPDSDSEEHESESEADFDSESHKSKDRGHDKGQNKGKGKGKKKAKKRKHPNLTDIKETKDTCRNRLEAKIFKRSTLKRVNIALDKAHMKMISDKFGHNFNYCLK